MKIQSVLLLAPALLVLAVACGDDETSATNAAGGSTTTATTAATGGNGGAATTAATGGAATTGTGGAGGGAAIDCTSYCGMMETNCTGANQQYLDNSNCMSACAAFAPGTEVNPTADNTLGCRIYHAGVAGTAMADVHCPHAGPLGDATCGDDCEGFCTILLATCNGQNEVFADMPACMASCNTPADYPDTGNKFDVADVNDGNGLNCRMYHLLAAQAGAPLHCPHTAGDNTDACQ